MLNLANILLVVLGLLAGAILGRRLKAHPSPPSPDLRLGAPMGPSATVRLSLEQLLRMIEANGGPAGLDLSGQRSFRVGFEQ